MADSDICPDCGYIMTPDVMVINGIQYCMSVCDGKFGSEPSCPPARTLRTQLQQLKWREIEPVPQPMSHAAPQ